MKSIYRLNFKVTLCLTLAVMLIVSLAQSSNLVLDKAQAQTSENPNIEINIVGDVHNMAPVNTNSILKLKSAFSAGDLNILNLETAITDYNVKEIKKYNFKTHPQFLDTLSQTGFNLFNIANNHTYDYGLKGFKDTLNALEDRNLTYVGGGLDKEKAYNGVTIDIKGLRLGILSFAKVNGGPKSIATSSKPGITDGYNVKEAIKSIKEMKKRSDLVIILTHWGAENTTCPRLIERSSASSWLKAGADIIVGGHSHTIQPVELKDNKLVSYSLGNFIFYSTSALNRQTGILHLTITPEKVISYSFSPYTIDIKSKVPTPTKNNTFNLPICK